MPLYHTPTLKRPGPVLHIHTLKPCAIRVRDLRVSRACAVALFTAPHRDSMHWQSLLAVVAALTVAGVSATPVERAVVTFDDPNVQSVLDADYSQFQPTTADDGRLDQQSYGAIQDGGDQEPTGTGHLSQWSRQNKVRRHSSASSDESAFSSDERSETTTGRVPRGAPQQRCRRLGHRHGQRGGRPGQSRFRPHALVPVHPSRDSPEGCRALADRTRCVLTLAGPLAREEDVDPLGMARLQTLSTCDRRMRSHCTTRA